MLIKVLLLLGREVHGSVARYLLAAPLPATVKCDERGGERQQVTSPYVKHKQWLRERGGPAVCQRCVWGLVFTNGTGCRV